MVAVVLGALALLALLARTPPVERVPGLAEQPVTVIAHAGAQAYAPQNTMPAFELALELGAHALEMDLQLSADGHVVVIHDGTVDATTEGTGRVADLTLDELRELDAGHAFPGPDGDFPYRDRGVRIPTLDEVLTAFPDEFLVIEMKTDSGAGIVDAVEETLAAHGRTRDVLVASFDADYLQAFRARVPGVPTNLSEEEVRRFYTLHLVGLHRWWRPPGQVLQVPEATEGRRLVTHRLLRAAGELGLQVHVWTVNERADMARMLVYGVHGIITDYPDRAVAVLAEGPPDLVVPEGDAGLARTLQAELAFLEPLMRWLTLLGDEEFYVVVFPLLYWCVHRRLGLHVGVALLTSAGLNAAAKLAVASPRPFFFDADAGLVAEDSLGIPSGHAQNAVAVWGLVAAELRRRWVWAVALVLIVGISLSRVYLGVHFLIDVVVGWALGALVLVGFLWARGPVRRWWAASRTGQQMLSAVGASLALVCVGAIARLARLGWQVPPGWVDDAGLAPEVALGLADVVTAAGALAGLGVGVALLAAGGGFAVTGAWWRRALRYPIGLLGIVVLWMGLGALLPDGETLVPLTLRYLRYALLGVWIGGVAPLAFVRLGLAGRAAAHQAAVRE